MAIEQMVSVTLPARVWEAVSELIWDTLPAIPCEGCGGVAAEGCGICQGTGVSTVWNPAHDHDPIALAEREIDNRIMTNHLAIARGAWEKLKGII